MSEWFVYQQSQQSGPFAQDQVIQMINSKMIAQDAYLFKVGWKDWRPIEDAIGELGSQRPDNMPTEAPAHRRDGAPRASIDGRVIVHNNGQLVIGTGVNISSTGIFVETPDQIFKLDEELKLTCRVDGFSKPFNVMAKVIRFNDDERYPVGYGLQFQDLEEDIALEVQKRVDKENLDKDPQQDHG